VTNCISYFDDYIICIRMWHGKLKSPKKRFFGPLLRGPRLSGKTPPSMGGVPCLTR
jgi:hypothetical protein